MTPRISGAIKLLGVALAFASQAVYAQPTVVTVTDAEAEGWFAMDQAGAATAAITTTEGHGTGGTGSIEFSTSGDSADRIHAARVPLVKMSEIVEVGYDFLSADASLAPAMKLAYWNPQRYGTLVYIPSGYTASTWTTVDGTVGEWWSTEFGEGDLRTLADWQLELGDIPVTFLQVGVGTGFPYDGETFADMVHLNDGSNDTIWDFEGEEQLPPAPQVIVTVDENDPAGWFEMDQTGGASGSLSTNEPHGPGGTGSMEFLTSGDTSDVIHAARVPAVRMNEITGVGYDFFSANATLAPSLKLQYWNASRFGTLVYEPINQGAYPTSQWNSVDGNIGLWWSTEFGAVDKRTLADWQSDLGDILVTFLQVGVGSGWSAATTSYSDLVYLQTAGTNTMWDFEGVEQLPPPPQVLVTVDPENPEGWFAMDQAGSATAALSTTQPNGPGATGSLEFNTTGDTTDIIHVARIPLMLLTDIQEIGYQFYSDNATYAPSLKVQYWSVQHFGTLVYEPNGQGSYPTGQWNSVDGMEGLWWSTEFGQEDKRPLDQWQTALGDMLVNFLQVGVGSGWGTATQTFADLVYVATSGSNTVWDFEGEEELPPPPLEIVTVDATDAQGWFAMDQAGAATGAITETMPHGPGNLGSLEFSTTGSADIINSARTPVVTVGDIRYLAYDFYSDDATLAPALKLQYWSAQRYGTLVYEPYVQGSYPTGAWNSAEASAGTWWSTEFGQTDQRTFDQWQTELGNILVTVLQVGVGSGWATPTTTFADLVQLQTNVSNTMWDFESEAVLLPPPADIATFLVTKYFSDGSTAPVDVTLTCNGGLPLEQTATINGGDPAGVTFTSTNVTPGQDCEVTESGAPDGYRTVMNGGAGCYFEDVVAGQPYECRIWNVAEFATFTVTHLHMLDGPGEGTVSDAVEVDIICQTPIVDSEASYDPMYGAWVLSDLLSDGETLTATLLAVTDPAYCMAQASSADSAIGITDDCDWREIPGGTDDECTITSSVFFEGIPALSPYGLALLVMLTLGIGAVGLRRFA